MPSLVTRARVMHSHAPPGRTDLYRSSSDGRLALGVAVESEEEGAGDAPFTVCSTVLCLWL